MNGVVEVKNSSLAGMRMGARALIKIKLKRARVLRFVEGAWIKGCRVGCVGEMTKFAWVK